MTHSTNPPPAPHTAPRRGRKFAAVAGATGALAAATAEAVPYTPTVGVAAAQNIPGFSFVTSTNVTLGSLEPPSVINTSIVWDVDGSGSPDYQLENWKPSVSIAARLGYLGQNKLRVVQGEGLYLQNLATNVLVGPGTQLRSTNVALTVNGGLAFATGFTLNQPGQFGFSFSGTGGTYYGWGSLVIDGTPIGQGFKITEAYYNTSAGAGINVGAVPVPEPTGMALLAMGAAGVIAWRARREQAE